MIPPVIAPLTPPTILSPRVSKEDEIAKLKDQLLKAQEEISQLKTERTVGKGPGEGHESHSRALLPNMMPGKPHHLTLFQ